MGGTSTDVSLIEGELPQRFEHQLAGVRLMQPMLDVHSIAAGGGSVLAYRDARFAVGPESAGAEPGTCLLRARRSADAHRCAGAARAAATRHPAAGLRAPRGRRDRHRGGAGGLRRAHRPGGRRHARHPHARGARRVLPRGRGRVDGQRHPPGVHAPGARRRGLHPVLLRRSRRPACLSRGARGGPRPHPRAPARERPVRLRHRGGRSARGAPGELAPRAERGPSGAGAKRLRAAGVPGAPRARGGCRCRAREPAARAARRGQRRVPVGAAGPARTGARAVPG